MPACCYWAVRACPIRGLLEFLNNCVWTTAPLYRWLALSSDPCTGPCMVSSLFSHPHSCQGHLYGITCSVPPKLHPPCYAALWVMCRFYGVISQLFTWLWIYVHVLAVIIWYLIYGDNCTYLYIYSHLTYSSNQSVCFVHTLLYSHDYSSLPLTKLGRWIVYLNTPIKAPYHVKSLSCKYTTLSSC